MNLQLGHQKCTSICSLNQEMNQELYFGEYTGAKQNQVLNLQVKSLSDVKAKYCI